jgi:hypothetical protein
MEGNLRDPLDIIPDLFFYVFLGLIVPLLLIVVIWTLWRIPC